MYIYIYTDMLICRPVDIKVWTHIYIYIMYIVIIPQVVDRIWKLQNITTKMRASLNKAPILSTSG